MDEERDRLAGAPLEPWYVTGFVEGAGCFTFSRNGRALTLYLAVKGTTTDRAALEEVRSFFGGAGRIYELAARLPAATPGVLYYRVTRLSDLRIVVAHFERYPLRGSKAHAYSIWREMFDLKCANVRRPAAADLDLLAGRLSTASRRKSRLRSAKQLEPPDGRPITTG